MTVTYTHEVANARLGGFSNLLFRWRGSVYKLFYKEFVIYITLYIILSMSYRFIDNSDFRTYFEKLCLQFQSYTDLVPISFVLGFYVSVVVGRWWKQYEYIPWPDRLMIIIAANVHGSDNRGRLIRRTLMRYVNLAQVLTYRSISTAVFKRFPTMQHVIDAGFMTPAEYKQYENVKTNNVKYFIPCVWFSNLLSKVRQELRIYDDMTFQTILKELNDFRGCCGMLFSYDWISIPLVYTQVVTVAVYVFFMSTLLSRQYLDVDKHYKGHEVDLYVPIFTICQFFFYVGWLKVAEQLINPFGEDDDDFEVNAIIDRNLELSMLTVDEMYLSHPKIEKDIYWNNPNPSIPYTAAAANHKLDAFLGSTVDMSVDRQDMQFVEHPQSPLAAAEGWDVNHNHIDKANETLLRPLPTSGPPTKQTQFANLWKRFTGRDNENEAKKTLLKMDFLSPRTRNGIKNEMIAEEEGEDGTVTPDSEDSSDSDVGDGGRSEDDDSDDNRSKRRTSLSSEDDEKEDKGNPTDSKNSLGIRKHSIEESEDRPQAKKPKSSALMTPATSEIKIKILPPKNKTAEKPRRPDILIPNFSEGNLKSLGGRLALGRRKSPKKKTNVLKFPKRIDFTRNNSAEMEEERKNAQTRTIGLLKASKKKSVQALQRNAKRSNYPGNAWLRHKYPPPWSAGENASMTSGAEDHGKQDYDSPFGSIISFGTSIPSPRPLRFSQFGKVGKRRHCDSASVSSCMTSPCANDDYCPSLGFLNHSPKAREDLYFHGAHQTTNPVSMPFTEDLRRRLFIVNTNTPNSSNATSPVTGRHFPPHHHFPAVHDSDDLLMIAPYNRPGSTTPWGSTLEVIGEVAPSEKSSNSTEIIEHKPKVEIINEQQAKKDPVSANDTTNIADPDAKTITSDTQTLPLISQHERSHSKTKSQQTILRSKSCSDVPISQIGGSPNKLEQSTTEKYEPSEPPSKEKVDHASNNYDSSFAGTDHDTNGSVDSFAVTSQPDLDPASSVSSLLKEASFSGTDHAPNNGVVSFAIPAQPEPNPSSSEPPIQTDASSFHCENEYETSVDSQLDLKHHTDGESEENEHVFNSSYTELPHYQSSEFTPLLQQEGTDEELEIANEMLPTEIHVAIDETPATEEDSSPAQGKLNGLEILTELPVSSSPSRKRPPPSVASDLGYCSSKEDSDVTASVMANDALSNIRHMHTSTTVRNDIYAVSETLRKLNSEIPTTSNVFKLEDQSQQFEIPETVVLPISPSKDVVIDMS